jgi:hypothetical protein
MGSYLNAAARPAPSTRAFSVEAGYERGEHVNDDGQPEGTTIIDLDTGQTVDDPEAYLAGPTPVAPQDPVAIMAYQRFNGGSGFPNFGIAQDSAAGETVGLDSNPFLTSAVFTNQDGANVDFSVTSGSPAETGQDLALNVDWGRWAAADYEVLEDGTAISVNSDYHYIFARRESDLTTASDLSGLTGVGTATYSLSGGTSPTDINGGTVSLTALNMTVDFTNQTIPSANLQAGGFNLSGSASSLSPSFSISLSDSNSTDSGQLAGSFVGAQAEGAMVIYNASDSDATAAVHGAALLER